MAGATITIHAGAKKQEQLDEDHENIFWRTSCDNKSHTITSEPTGTARGLDVHPRRYQRGSRANKATIHSPIQMRKYFPSGISPSGIRPVSALAFFMGASPGCDAKQSAKGSPSTRVLILKKIRGKDRNACVTP
jgi:hypothetical protein